MPLKKCPASKCRMHQPEQIRSQNLIFRESKDMTPLLDQKLLSYVSGGNARESKAIRTGINDSTAIQIQFE